MKLFFEKYGQLCFNIFLFGFFVDVLAHSTYERLFGIKSGWGLAWYDIYLKGHWSDAPWSSLHFIDWSFLIQNVTMCVLVLIRSRHRAVDGNWLHQFIAMFAFLSGALIFGTAAMDNRVLVWLSTVVILAANTIGLASLLNLGRSFGILIALRTVKTGGLYSVVRHPMYCSDMLLRVGFIIGHFSVFVLVVGVLSIACYVIRAILEERFLSRADEYRTYMGKVKYRFIPFIY